MPYLQVMREMVITQFSRLYVVGPGEMHKVKNGVVK